MRPTSAADLRDPPTPDRRRPPPAVTQRVRELFFEVLDTPRSARLAWLDRRCVGLPPSARAELDGLLHAHDAADGFLDAPSIEAAGPSGPGLPSADSSGPSDPAADPGRPTADADVPTVVGPYRIVRRLGSGGFGTVYLAEQDRPVRRRVALKLINPGMDTRRVIARFRAERQALARMNHPNVARVLDAGATDAGRPYFVMEWVAGQTLTDYCRTRHPSLADRLRLFVDVCRGVRHAHQRGVIHRDLKPGNVLVAEPDEGRPVPKVIDFGVAKALDGRLDDETDPAADAGDGGVWATGSPLTAGPDGRPVAVGTPHYMSPEQAAGGVGVDARTDVYALGALLYELLAGVPAFDPVRLRAARPDELARILRNETPPPPSRRAAAEAARVPVELDWIVGLAMAKEAGRRYPTADALAADVGRYLADEPVVAAPPTRRYKLATFARRHRRPLRAAAAVLAVAGAGGSAATVGFVRAHDARARAAVADAAAGLAAARAAEQSAARDRAEQEAARAARLVQGAQSLLHEALVPRAGEPGDGQAADLRRLDALDAWAARRWTDAPPELAAPLHAALAFAFTDGGAYEKAGEHAAAAARLHQGLGPAFDAKLAGSLSQLGASLAGQGKMEEAERAYAAAVAAGERYDGADDAHDLTAPALRVNRAIALLHLHRTPEAGRCVDDAVAAVRAAPRGGSPRQEAELLETFANALRIVGDREGAAAYAARARAAKQAAQP